MITLNVNNNDTLVMMQNAEDETVHVRRHPDGEDSNMDIPAGDMVMLLNYYRYVKEEDIRCDFVNPGGKRNDPHGSSKPTKGNDTPVYGTWVDVDDRLPETKEWVIVTYDDCTVGESRLLAVSGCSWDSKGVVAWMPMPPEDSTRWISVSARLPLNEGDYLVKTDEGTIAVLYYKDRGGCMPKLWVDGLKGKVVAWTELPLPCLF